MTFTDNSDIFGSLHEDGINTLVSHVEYKRPSLFNYASGQVADNRKDLFCQPIDAAPEVIANGNPIVTRVDPVPVLGTEGAVALDFCFQLTELALDFAPGNTSMIPDEAELTVKDNQFGIFVRVCAGLACPSDVDFTDIIDDVRRDEADPERGRDPVVPRTDQIHCFCIDAYATGSLDLKPPGANTSTVSLAESPTFTVDDIAVLAAEFEDGQLPEGFRKSVECYLEFVVQFAVLPQVATAVEQIVPMLVGMMDGLLSDIGTTLAITTPTSGALPDNPAIQEDELRLFVDMDMGVAP